ncbi:hypothetical protein GCM10010916_17430 [Paenibacillus abyssi]|uniref:Uncharacterized protein n=1 Tax=Paenibacillus abyssi TaxID=1340531 RepID=A0A917FR02_9BACL|nr:hypothetical protein GCM10010916_17430 [Paenibacillus abyssi]
MHLHIWAQFAGICRNLRDHAKEFRFKQVYTDKDLSAAINSVARMAEQLNKSAATLKINKHPSA